MPRLIPWYEKTSDDAGWVDSSVEAWKAQFGGDAAFARLRDAVQQPVNPNLAARLRDWLNYRANQFKLALIFFLKVMRDGRRGTHEYGVAMSGTMRVADDVDTALPPNALLKPGRAFQVKGRFASVALDDETFSLARGIGFSFAPADDPGDVQAFGMNTGIGSVFWNQQTFWNITQATISVRAHDLYFDSRKVVYAAQPQAYWGSVSTTRRRVTSFSHLAYYSQQPYAFVASDGKPRFVRFVLRPSASNDGPPNETPFLFTRAEQDRPWDQTGEYADAVRPARDYLSAEIRQRLATGRTVEFDLCAQVWDRQPGDPAEVLSINYHWDMPWRTVAQVVFEKTLGAEETRKLDFRLSTRSRTGVFDLPEVEGWHGALKYASFGHARQEMESLSVWVRTWRHRVLALLGRRSAD